MKCLSVGQLIEELNEYNPDVPVYLSVSHGHCGTWLGLEVCYNGSAQSERFVLKPTGARLVLRPDETYTFDEDEYPFDFSH